MPPANSRKWQPIDLEIPFSDLPINERTEAEPEECSFDDWGVESTSSLPVPTPNTKRGGGAPGALVVIQANPKPPRSSEMAPGLPPKCKRKYKAEDEDKKPNTPETKGWAPSSTSQQPWDSACKAPSCPIKYLHNYGLSPFEPPHQHLQKYDLLAASTGLDKLRKSSKEFTSAKHDLADDHFANEATEAVDKEDETIFLGCNVYMPPEVDSAEQRKIHHKSTSEDKKLLQAFYSAHGSKRQYYGFRGNGIQHHKYSDVSFQPLKSNSLSKESQKKDSKKKDKGKRDNSKSDHRILPHG